MLKNYLLVSLRLLRRHPGYSLIKVLGMAVALASFLLILLYVGEELSYDRFHADSERIFRVVQEEAEGRGLAWSGPQMGLRMERDFPQLESVVRVIDGAHGYGTSATISAGPGGQRPEQLFEEDGFLYADPGFFEFFSFALVRGVAGEVLSAPNSVVLTASMARKHFGSRDPVGETIILDGRHQLEVTGVAADPPTRSHLDFQFVASYRTFYAKEGIPGEVDSFWWPPTHTYVKLRDGASIDALRAELPAFAQRHRDSDDAERMTLVLQPLTEIWVGPPYQGQQQAGGSRTYVYLLSVVALVVLILACINFTNLATARAAERTKEVGLRKTVGAARGQLVTQFMSGTILLSLFALPVAIGISQAALPLFNGIVERSLVLPFSSLTFWAVLVGVIAITGALAGAYPALELSAVSPAAAVKGVAGRWLGRENLRKSLVVFQFAVSVALMVGTVVVYQQLRYVQETNLGFDKEHVISVRAGGLEASATSGSDRGSTSRYEALQAELMRRSTLQAMTTASSRPGMGGEATYVWDVEGLPAADRQFPVEFVDEGFFDMMGLTIVEGRALRGGDPADIGSSRLRTDQDLQTRIIEDRAFVINESAAARFQWSPEEAIGKWLRFYIIENGIVYQDYRGTVVGVVKDHHNTSLHEPIGPTAYMATMSPGGQRIGLRYVLVKMAPGGPRQALHDLEEVWTDVVPDQPFQASFLDEQLASMYRTEVRVGRLISTFAGLAIFIACLGLLGLAALSAQQRSKEIGVRKALGATVANIVGLLSRDFVKLVIVAFLLAAPVAYVGMSRWLDNFAYRTEMGLGIFLLTGGLALATCIITISFHAIRAATADPVRALRNE